MRALIALFTPPPHPSLVQEVNFAPPSPPPFLFWLSNHTLSEVGRRHAEIEEVSSAAFS